MHRFIKAVGAGAKRARALDRDEAREAMGLIASGDAAPEQVGAFLLALRMRGESATELAGFVDALGATTVRAAAPPDTLEVDAHGDGHEGVASLLPAAACAASALGVPVWLGVDARSPDARHGLAGGLGAIGLADRAAPAAAAEDIGARGVAACALDEACPPLARLLRLRPLLGVRTVAQTLAKLVSPIDATRRVVGAFHAPYVAPMAAALGMLGGVERGLVVQALGGLPEARPGKLLRVADAGAAEPRTLDLRAFAAAPDARTGGAHDGVLPGSIGSPARERDLGGAPAAAADMDALGEALNRAALDGEPGAARAAAATAGLLLHAATGADPIDAAERALAALLDGRARARVRR